MDQRIKVTKLILKNALLSLMEEEELTSISITKLCKKATINRNTFYNHYDSITDLYNEIEEQLIQEIHLTLIKPYTRKKRLYEICKTIKNDISFFKLIFSQDNTSPTINKLLMAARRIFNYDANNNSHQYIYRESGTTAILKNWVINDCRDNTEQIALLLHKLNTPSNISL